MLQRINGVHVERAVRDRRERREMRVGSNGILIKKEGWRSRQEGRGGARRVWARLIMDQGRTGQYGA